MPVGDDGLWPMRCPQQPDGLQIRAGEDGGRRVRRAQQALATLVASLAGPVHPGDRPIRKPSRAQSQLPAPFARVCVGAAHAADDEPNRLVVVDLPEMLDRESGASDTV